MRAPCGAQRRPVVGTLQDCETAAGAGTGTHPPRGQAFGLGADGDEGRCLAGGAEHEVALEAGAGREQDDVPRLGGVDRRLEIVALETRMAVSCREATGVSNRTDANAVATAAPPSSERAAQVDANYASQTLAADPNLLTFRSTSGFGLRSLRHHGGERLQARAPRLDR